MTYDSITTFESIVDKYGSITTFGSTLDELKVCVSNRRKLRREIFKVLKSNRELVKEADPQIHTNCLSGVKDPSLVSCCKRLVVLMRSKEAFEEAVEIILRNK